MRLRVEHGRRDDLRTLNPAYFALVMATGIVSIATHLHGIPVLPKVLFWLSALFLAGLAAATKVVVSGTLVPRSVKRKSEVKVRPPSAEGLMV